MSIRIVSLKLSEMADICHYSQGFGYSVVLFSNDHYPPHVHIKNESGRTIYRIVIPGFDISGYSVPHNKTDNIEIDEIIPIDKDIKIPNKQKSSLVKMWNSISRGNKRWFLAYRIWKSIHKDSKY